jgi:hypothetical protein
MKLEVSTKLYSLKTQRIILSPSQVYSLHLQCHFLNLCHLGLFKQGRQMKHVELFDARLAQVRIIALTQFLRKVKQFTLLCTHVTFDLDQI